MKKITKWFLAIGSLLFLLSAILLFAAVTEQKKSPFDCLVHDKMVDRDRLAAHMYSQEVESGIWLVLWRQGNEYRTCLLQRGLLSHRVIGTAFGLPEQDESGSSDYPTVAAGGPVKYRTSPGANWISRIFWFVLVDDPDVKHVSFMGRETGLVELANSTMCLAYVYYPAEKGDEPRSWQDYELIK